MIGETIKIPEEIAGNKVLNERFEKLGDKEKILYIYLRELEKTSDLRDEDGKIYVRISNSEIEKYLGIKNGAYYYCNKLVNAGLIERITKKRIGGGTYARTYIKEIPDVFLPEQPELPKSQPTLEELVSNCPEWDGTPFKNIEPTSDENNELTIKERKK